MTLFVLVVGVLWRYKQAFSGHDGFWTEIYSISKREFKKRCKLKKKSSDASVLLGRYFG